MTELERRALLGDQKAQKECTEKGIVLPCPFCGSQKIIMSNWGMWRCWCYNCKSKADDTLSERDALKSWNTRPAPPIGRCGTCKHSMSQEIYCELGHLWALKPDDYCSRYEPREGK